MKKIFRNKKAVSEIVGTAILLGMAVALFSVVHIVAMNVIPFTPNPPSVRISSEINTTTNTIYLLHNGGSPLSLDTIVIFSDYDTGVLIADAIVSGSIIYETDNGDDAWNIGEILFYTNPNFSNNKIQMIIVDIKSNSIIAQDIFDFTGVI